MLWRENHIYIQFHQLHFYTALIQSTLDSVFWMLTLDAAELLQMSREYTKPLSTYLLYCYLAQFGNRGLILYKTFISAKERYNLWREKKGEVPNCSFYFKPLLESFGKESVLDFFNPVREIKKE